MTDITNKAPARIEAEESAAVKCNTKRERERERLEAEAKEFQVAAEFCLHKLEEL